MKKMKVNGLILALITMLVLFFVLKDNFLDVMAVIGNANWLWLVFAFLIMLAYSTLQSLSLHNIILEYHPKYKFTRTLQLILITHFFNGITPFSTGGQPLEIYLLSKDGIRATKGTNIIMQNFILYQLALVILGLLALFFNYQFHIFKDLPVMSSLILFGFIINTAVMVGIFIISFGTRFNKFVVNVVIKLLAKLKIVKNKQKAIERWNERCDDFHEGATFLKENKMVCVKGFIYNFLSLVLLYSIPYFVFLAFHAGSNVNLLTTIVSSAYVMVIGAFVPIPGASGGIEYGFLQFFGTFIQGPVLSAVLLLWRFITYYLPMLLGGILLSLRKDAIKE